MRRIKATSVTVATAIQKPDEQWRHELTRQQYDVLRRGCTEPAFTGEYVHARANGSYCCAGCGNELFRSDAKFESGTGWPGFSEPAVAQAVEQPDDRLGAVPQPVITRGEQLPVGVQFREPCVGIIAGAFLPAVDRAEPDDTVVFIDPRNAALRGEPEPVHQRAPDRQDTFLSLRRDRGEPAQLPQPRILNLPQVRVQPRQRQPEILSQAADRRPRTTAI